MGYSQPIKKTVNKKQLLKNYILYQNNLKRFHILQVIIKKIGCFVHHIKKKRK